MTRPDCNLSSVGSDLLRMREKIILTLLNNPDGFYNLVAGWLANILLG